MINPDSLTSIVLAVSTIVPDTPHKLFIGGLPNYLNEDQVRLFFIRKVKLVPWNFICTREYRLSLVSSVIVRGVKARNRF